VAEPTVAAAYRQIVRSRVAAQASYRTSFAVEVVSQVFIVLVEFVEVYAVFHQVDDLGGFDFAEVSLIYGLSVLSFGIADLVVGHLDQLPFYVRTGTFDALLLRPLSPLGQLVTSDFSLRRLGRVGTGIAVLAVALVAVDVDWTPARVLLAVVTPLAGAVIFSAIFVATSTIGFWVVEGMEFTNAFTYGGNYLSSFPFTVFGTATAGSSPSCCPSASWPTCRRSPCSAGPNRSAGRTGCPGRRYRSPPSPGGCHS